MTPIEFKKFIDAVKAILPLHAPEFDAYQLSAWFKIFEKYEAHQLFAVLGTLHEKYTRFPAIKELLDAIDPKPDHDAEARAVVDKIWTAIERFGSARGKDDKIREAVGDLGMRLVKQLGGWLSVCNCASYDDASTIKAQWRESAKAMMHIEQVDERRAALGLGPSHERQALPDSQPVFDALSLVNLKAVRPE